jgi:ribulose 1,5-bisphosphate synthetase/thiazole synthase
MYMYTCIHCTSYHILTLSPIMANKAAKKRVLVVGAGSAGMSCADALANHPDKFETTLIGTPYHIIIGSRTLS